MGIPRKYRLQTPDNEHIGYEPTPELPRMFDFRRPDIPSLPLAQRNILRTEIFLTSFPRPYEIPRVKLPVSYFSPPEFDYSEELGEPREGRMSGGKKYRILSMGGELSYRCFRGKIACARPHSAYLSPPEPDVRARTAERREPADGGGDRRLQLPGRALGCSVVFFAGPICVNVGIVGSVMLSIKMDCAARVH